MSRKPLVYTTALAVLGLILLAITRELYPTTRLGSILQSPVGALSMSVTWLLIAFYLGTLFFRRNDKHGG